MQIVSYTPERATEWNQLVRRSAQGVFLPLRGYMDYHADRFTDASLMVYDTHHRLVGVLPACRIGTELHSHAGLTYGGWITDPRLCDAIAMMEIWDAMTAYLHENGYTKLTYKAVPHIYHTYVAEEDRYAIFRAGGKLSRVLVSSAIDLRDPLPMAPGPRGHARKFINDPATEIGPSERWADFWAILSERLGERYDATPVHSLAEIMMLHERFGENIRLYTATRGGEILAGTVLFMTPTVAHSQYIGSTEPGRRGGAVAALHAWLTEHLRGSVRYFDLGTSNEADPRQVNEGLLHQKTHYGARAVAYETYEINL